VKAAAAIETAAVSYGDGGGSGPSLDCGTAGGLPVDGGSSARVFIRGYAVTVFRGEIV